MSSKPCASVYLILFLLSLATPGFAQPYWARTQTGANVDETLGVTGDNNGNTFATGYFSTTASISGNTLSSSGLTDIFVTRINTDGTTAWSVKAGGTQSDRGLGITTDPSGNVIVCGFFTGTASFGNGISLTANGASQDAFVAKYNSAGVAQWARAGGSSGNSDRANDVTTDNSGNVFITGQYTGEASFGAFNLSGTAASNDVFVVKYSPDGSELWAKSGNGPSLNRGLGITTDSNGAVYACGQFSNDITFDNTYNNTVLNALFVVKYSSSGTEEWMRYASGSAQSIAYDITSNGTNVYFTGDCGQNLTFVNAPTTPALTTPYDNAVFVAAFNPSGGYLWGSAKGSDSPVSGRGISHRNGELGIAGWYECTYDGLSEEYGESTFNSIGFRDVFVSRYNTAGVFQWARNFGSQTNEVASGIHILPDNLEVVSGTFTGDFIVPISDAQSGNGMTAMSVTIPGDSYCGDNNYTDFSYFEGVGSDDGFLLKAVNLNRQPYDYYRRFGTGCNLDIPELCIHLASQPLPPPGSCPDFLEGCIGYGIVANNYASYPNADPPLAYAFNVQWSTGNTGTQTSVNNPGTITATLTSVDGCYTQSQTVEVDVVPPPDKPLMSDNQGVNNMALNTQFVFICPGETVTLTGTAPFPGNWAGPSIPPGQSGNTSITVGITGNYSYTITDANGCTAFNTIQVVVEEIPDIPDPIMVFPVPGDSINICQGGSLVTFIEDQNTDGTLPAFQFDWEWSSDPEVEIFGNNPASVSVDASGWYTVSVSFTPVENPCVEDSTVYVLSDSIYINVNPNPELIFEFTPPPVSICPGDTVWAYFETNADLVSMDPSGDPAIIIGDSIAITQGGEFIVTASLQNEFLCGDGVIVPFSVSTQTTPGIESLDEDAVICPGETVNLFTTAEGNYNWQGPGGFAGDSASIFVDEPGLYFLILEFYPGCSLVSNTLQVAEYSTPFISGSNEVLCPGDTIELSVLTGSGSSIVWAPPLPPDGGSTQIVSEPGIYGVTVESCDIQTSLEIEVVLSPFALEIALDDDTPVCAGDSILVLANDDFYSDYEWFGAIGQGPQAWALNNGGIQATAVDSFGCSLTSNVLQIAFEPIPPAPTFSFTQPCIGDPLVVNVSGGFDIAWLNEPEGDLIFDGSQVSIDSLLSDTTFFVQLSSAFCTGPIGQVSISPKPRPQQPIPATDAPVCTGTSFALSVLNAEPDATYSWTLNGNPVAFGAETSFFASSMEQEGIYQVSGEIAGCRGDSAAIEIGLIETRWVSLPPDTALCLEDVLALSADTIFSEYQWQDGSTEPTFTPSESGSFSLLATDFNGCKSSAIIDVELSSCIIIIPNIFTPNGDGFNDSWVPRVDQTLYIWIQVYNRWGTVVFESEEAGSWWNGTHYRSGAMCSSGVYFYIIRFIPIDGLQRTYTGNVTLLRD